MGAVTTEGNVTSEKSLYPRQNYNSDRHIEGNVVSGEALYPRGALYPRNHGEKCYTWKFGISVRIVISEGSFHPLGTLISGDRNFLKEPYISGTVIFETNLISEASLHQGDHARNVLSW